MLVMIVHIIIPVRETDYRISALTFLFVLFLCDCRFQFGSVFRITNLY